MPTLRVPDPLYQEIKEFAERENRTINNAANHIIASFLSENRGTPKNTEVENLRVGEIPKPEEAEYHPAKVDDLFQKNSGATPQVAEDASTDLELPCCKNEVTPCKHWVWDVQSGEGYRNSISGRFMEVEG